MNRRSCGAVAPRSSAVSSPAGAGAGAAGATGRATLRCANAAGAIGLGRFSALAPVIGGGSGADASRRTGPGSIGSRVSRATWRSGGGGTGMVAASEGTPRSVAARSIVVARSEIVGRRRSRPMDRAWRGEPWWQRRLIGRVRRRKCAAGRSCSCPGLIDVGRCPCRGSYPAPGRISRRRPAAREGPRSGRPVRPGRRRRCPRSGHRSARPGRYRARC